MYFRLLRKADKKNTAEAVIKSEVAIMPRRLLRRLYLEKVIGDLAVNPVVLQGAAGSVY